MDTRPPGVELALGALPAQFFIANAGTKTF